MSKENLTRKSLAEMRLEYKLRTNCIKYPRQKLLPKYQDMYPWLIADDSDPCFVFCVDCECRLTAKSCDLTKHQNSIKHCENIIKMGVRKRLNESQRQGPPTAMNNNMNQNTPMCSDLVKDVNYANFIKKINNLTENTSKKTAKPQNNVNVQPKNIRKPLASGSSNDFPDLPSKDTAAISDPNISKLMMSTPCTITLKPPVCNDIQPQVKAVAAAPESKVEPTRAKTPQRDPCVIFFESVCASIKSLPPKLAAEGKVRIMQLIGELEVRALEDCKQQNPSDAYTTGAKSSQ